jgi:hypothetical protein
MIFQLIYYFVHFVYFVFRKSYRILIEFRGVSRLCEEAPSER